MFTTVCTHVFATRFQFYFNFALQSCGIHWNPVPFRWTPLASTGFHWVPPEWPNSSRNRGGTVKYCDELRQMVNDGEFEADEELVSQICLELSKMVIVVSLSFQNHLHCLLNWGHQPFPTTDSAYLHAIEMNLLQHHQLFFQNSWKTCQSLVIHRNLLRIVSIPSRKTNIIWCISRLVH